MSGSVEVPLRPPHRRLGRIAEAVLEAIPTDRWVTSAEVAARVGVSGHKVAMVIRYRLLYEHVERSPQRKPEWGSWLYRRIAYVGGRENAHGKCPSCGALSAEARAALPLDGGVKCQDKGK